MSVIMEEIQANENVTKISILKQKIEDCMTLLFVTGHLALFYWATACVIWIPLLLYFHPPSRITFLLYSCWIYYDRNTPTTGGRKSKWFCNLYMHSLLRNYFSNRLIKTADLPEERNYILAHYPHGVLPFNVATNFATYCNKVADLFPGIEMHYVSVDMAFFLPVLRDFLLVSGGCSCHESSIKYLLKNPPYKGVVVVPGGSSEVKYVNPDGIYTIIKRKGFVRIALATGTPLVPVFTFGELNAWTKLVPIPVWRPFEKLIKRKFKSNTEVYIGIGRGILPKRVPVNTIVGAPISVPKVENPSNELTDEYYNKFYQALQELFEQYKHENDPAGENAKLIMVSDSQ